MAPVVECTDLFFYGFIYFLDNFLSKENCDSVTIELMQHEHDIPKVRRSKQDVNLY